MKKPRPPAGMLIFNLRFWIVLSVVIDNGTNAFNFHSRKLDNTIRRTEHRYSNHPIDSVYDSSPYPSNFKKSPIRPNFNGLAKNREFSSYPGSKVHELSNSDFDGLPSDIQFMSSKRNANDKSQFLNHTTIVAHMVNGIYLQSGLINGKIPIDDLVGELFNFGSVSVSDIVNFKSDKVTALASKFKSVRDSLSNENDADAVEKQALVWNEWWLKSQSVINLNLDTIPNKAEYEKDVSNFESSKFFDLFAAVYKAYKDVEDRFGMIDKHIVMPLANDNDSLLATLFKQLNTAFKAYNENMEKLKNFINAFDSSYKWLKKGPEVFEPLEKMIDLMKTRVETTTSSAERVKVANQNVDKVIKSVDDAKSASRDMSIISGLTENIAHLQPARIEHTRGFLNGINDLEQLMKDVRDPWVAKILGLDVPKLNGLSNGLQPLFNIKDKLKVLNEKLELMSSSNLINSLRNLHKLQNETAGLPSIPANTAEVMEEYQKCLETNFEVTPADLGPNEKIMENIKALVNELNAGFHIIERIDAKELKQSTENFIKSLGFTDLGSNDKTKKEIPKVVEMLKKSGELGKIEKLVTESNSAIETIDATNLKTFTTSIKSSGLKIMSDPFKAAIKNEKGFYGCAKKFSDKADKFSQSIKVLQNLRTLKDEDIENVGKVASVVSELSKSLSDVKSIPKTMKEQAKEVTTELSKMPDVKKNADSIGQTVRSLQYALALKKLESSISDLKNTETVVQSEIQKISNPDERKRVIKQWGDHRKHVTELENSIGTIKSFESKIDVSKAKTLSKYGDPLKEMTTLSDANIDPNAKIQALEVLIPSATDPKVKSELEEVKKTLESISTLDLAFANHKVQFQSAPGAFTALHNFLSQFLAVDYVKPTGEQGIWVFDPIKVGAALVLGAAIFFCMIARDCYNRIMSKKRRAYWQDTVDDNKENTSTPEQRVQWAKNQRYTDVKAAQADHQNILDMLDIHAKGQNCQFLSWYGWHWNRHRYIDIHCNPITNVSFKMGLTWLWGNAYFHANWITTRSGVEFIAAEAPSLGENGKKKANSEKFWGMILYYQVEFMVMLCNFKEPKPDGTDKKKCGVYFHVNVEEKVTCGRFTITTKTVETVVEGVIKRQLEITDTSTFRTNCCSFGKKFKTHTVTHYHYAEWPDQGVPRGHEAALKILKEVNGSKKPILVHCSAGVGRTVSFIGLQFVYDEITRDPKRSMYNAIMPLRESRYRSIQTYDQSYMVQVGVVYRLWLEEEDVAKKAELQKIYEKLEEMRLTAPRGKINENKYPLKRCCVLM